MDTQSKKKRVYHCSVCGKEGHKKNSCPNNIDYFDTNIMKKGNVELGIDGLSEEKVDTRTINDLSINEDITLLKPNNEDKKERVMKKILECIQNDITPSNTNVWIRNKECQTFHVSVIKGAQMNGINGDYLKIYLNILTDIDEINI